MDPHLYVMGPPGSGKTSLISLIYPNAYKKDLSSRFWDLYDPDSHTHTILEDLDMDNVEKLTVQFLKTICDEAGFPIDQKYKTPQLARTTVLVTSQYSIDQLINPENTSDCEGSKRALKRRFFCFQVWDLHRLLGIKLLPKYEIKMLQKEGNQDPAMLYMKILHVGTPNMSPKKCSRDNTMSPKKCCTSLKRRQVSWFSRCHSGFEVDWATRVLTVDEVSMAYFCGLRMGDVLLQINGTSATKYARALKNSLQSWNGEAALVLRIETSSVDDTSFVAREKHLKAELKRLLPHIGSNYSSIAMATMLKMAHLEEMCGDIGQAVLGILSLNNK
ncbi:Aste57867_24317 [Aphanomyces stellatus]|uniref:Aste57867_24317 protein n=1 Tax=Aphanomyces stellatus TaxID=120398 RepID=A0A485LQ50_9STRA|nr:hypothetical protein As57867_024242 [Aphanomyces stellatus]VFU00957.1 Aste57867_24317 [Aphanomyces stellatus]